MIASVNKYRDPYIAYNFVVEIEGLQIGGNYFADFALESGNQKVIIELKCRNANHADNVFYGDKGVLGDTMKLKKGSVGEGVVKVQIVVDIPKDNDHLPQVMELGSATKYQMKVPNTQEAFYVYVFYKLSY